MTTILTTDDAIALLRSMTARTPAGLPPELPTEIDRDFRELARFYVDADPKSREALRAAVTDGDNPVLRLMMFRPLLWALDSGDPSHLDDALTAHLIEDFRWDPRDNRMVLPIFWYAAAKLGVEPRKLMLNAEALGSVRAAAQLQDYLDTPPPKDLGSVGLEAFEQDGKIRFRPRAPRKKK